MPQNVIILDETGTRHIFPPGFDPQRAAAIVRESRGIQGPPAAAPVSAEPSGPDDRSWLRKAADMTIPMTLRVGGGVVGAIVGAGGGLVAGGGVGAVPGALAGRALGSAAGDVAAQGYELLTGQREAYSPGTTAVEAAMGAIPVIGKAGKPLATIVKRAAVGAGMGGAATAATDYSEGRPFSPSGTATGAALGTVLGGGAGALEARSLSKAAAQLKADAALTGAEKIAQLVAAQNAPPAKPPIVLRIANAISGGRSQLLNRGHQIEVEMKAKGFDPLRLAAEVNAAKQFDLIGGVAGQTEGDAIVAGQMIAQAKQAGVWPLFEEYANLMGLRHGAENLSNTAARAEREDILAEAARTIGREAKDGELDFDGSGLPMKHLPERGADGESLRDEPVPGAPRATARAATDSRRGVDVPAMAGGRGTVVQTNTGTMTLGPETARRDRFRMVPSGSPDEAPALRTPHTTGEDLPLRAEGDLPLGSKTELFTPEGDRITPPLELPETPEYWAAAADTVSGASRHADLHPHAKAELARIRQELVDGRAGSRSNAPIYGALANGGQRSGPQMVKAIETFQAGGRPGAVVEDVLRQVYRELGGGPNAVTRRLPPFHTTSPEFGPERPPTTPRDTSGDWLLPYEGRTVQDLVDQSTAAREALPALRAKRDAAAAEYGAAFKAGDYKTIARLDRERLSAETAYMTAESKASRLERDMTRMIDENVEPPVRRSETPTPVDEDVTPSTPTPPEDVALPGMEAPRAAADAEIATRKFEEKAVAERTQRQYQLKGLPTPSEIDAINARIDRGQLGFVDSSTAKARPERLTPSEVASIAEDLDVSVEHVQAFADAAFRKGGMPEWYIRASVKDAQQRGGWALEAGARLEKDDALQAGKALPRGLVPTDLTAQLQHFEERTDYTPEQKAHVREMFTQLENISREAIRDLTEGGMLTDAQVASLTRNSQGYVPLTRMIEDLEKAWKGMGRNLDVSSSKFLYKLNGSERDTDHPVVATLNKRSIARQEKQRNKTLQLVVEQTHATKLDPGAAVPKGLGFVTVYQQGVPTRYAVSKPLEAVFKETDPATANFAMKVLQKAGGVFRMTTTSANLLFAPFNVVRDVGTAAITTGGNRVSGVMDPRIWKDWVEAWRQVGRQDPAYIAHLRSGAAFSGFQRSISGPSAIPGAPRTGAARWNPLKPVENFNNRLEEATKLFAHTRFRDQGLSLDEAAWQTRRFGGSPDFARSGASMKELNTIVPFLNAQIQGVAQMVDYARLHPREAGMAAAAVSAKIAMVWMYNRGYTDPDGTRSLDRVTDREKQGNWIIMTPMLFTDPETGLQRHVYLKVPASHTYDLIKAPMEAMLNEETNTPKDVANAVVSGLPMSPQLGDEGGWQSLADTVVAALNPAMRVPIEQLANREAFRGVPIISRRMASVDPAEQSGPQTSPSAVALGHAMGASPARIEHAVRGFTGGVGATALAAVDSLQRDDPRKPVTEVPGLQQLTQLPIVGGLARPFVGRVMGGPASVDRIANQKKSRFYRTLDEAQQTRDTVNQLIKQGRTADAQARGASPRDRWLYSHAGSLNRLSQRIAALRRAGAKGAERQELEAIDVALQGMPEE